MSLEPSAVELGAEFRVRRSRPSDLEQVHQVEKRGQQAPWTIGVLQNEFDVEWSNIWVVERDDRIIAYLCFWTVADEVHILNVVVDPDARRNGIGKGLVEGLIEVAREAAYAIITLEVRVANLAAQGLYRAAGFKEIGRRAGYYSDNGEDAIVMACVVEEPGDVDPDG